MTTKLRHITALVRVTEALTVQITVPEWELHVVQAVHGTEGDLIDGNVLIERDPPNAGVELDRLAKRYGSTRDEDGRQGVSFVESVYGANRAGIVALGNAIKQATLEAENELLSIDDLVGTGVGGEQASTVVR